MNEKGLAILLLTGFLTITAGYLVIDYAYRYRPEDIEFGTFATNIFAFCMALFVWGISYTTLRIGRKSNLRLISTISELFFWLAFSNLIDEILRQNTNFCGDWEYLFSILGVGSAILEYHYITTAILAKAAYNYTKNQFYKIWLRYNGSRE